MDTREILLGAAEHIERYGWIQCVMVEISNPSGLQSCAACAVGAIKIVALQPVLYGDIGWFCPDDDAAPAIGALARTLNLTTTQPPVEAVATWNDSPYRSAEQVINALRLAAATVAT